MTRSIEALPRADFSPRAWGTCAPSLWGVKEGNLYDQIYRGSASSGLQSAYKNAPTGRTNSAPIITQGFNPGMSGHNHPLLWRPQPWGTGAPRPGLQSRYKLVPL